MTTDALVNEIKALYGRRHEEKLQIQADMVALRDEHGWTQNDIVKATGIPQPTVSQWMKAYDQWVAAGGNINIDKPGLTPASRQEASDRKVAKRVAKERPSDLVTELTPAEQRRLSTELETAAAIRQKNRKDEAAERERDYLGDETIEGIALKEELQSTEYLLIKARGNVRGFVQHTRELGTELPESWRDSCLEWVTDLEGHVGMAKALLVGEDVDWTAFEELLAKEGS